MVMPSEKIFEAVEKQLQEHKIVTFKWLSRTMKLHSTTAKKYLAEWVGKKPADKYVVTYTIFGRKENGELLLMLTKETDQDYFENKNITLIDRYVYSVQLSDSNFDPALIYNIDKSTYELQQMSLSSINYHTDIIRNNPKNNLDIVISSEVNGHGTCRNSQKKVINLNPNNVFQNENVDGRPSPWKNKTDEATTSNDQSNKEIDKMKPNSAMKNSKPSKSTIGSGSIANFFSKDSGKKESKNEPKKINKEKLRKVEVCENTEERGTIDIKSLEVNRGEAEAKKENITQTKSHRKSSKKEPAKKRQKKGKQMKRIFQLESDSEDESISSDGNIDDILETEPETVAVQQPETEACIKVIDGKKRKRKVVEDMKQDEEGFMHTTKRVVYESCDSEDEEEEEQMISDKNNLVQSNTAEFAPPEKKVKMEITIKKKQSSILSFFQKPQKTKTST